MGAICGSPAGQVSAECWCLTMNNAMTVLPSSQMGTAFKASARDLSTGGCLVGASPRLGTGGVQAPGERLHDLLLQPPQVEVEGEAWTIRIVFRHLSLVGFLRDVQLGPKHEAEVVDGPEPGDELVLRQTAGVQGRLHDAESLEMALQEVVPDQAAIFGARLGVVGVTGWEQPPHGRVLGGQDLPKLGGQRSEDLELLSREADLELTAPGGSHSSLRVGHGACASRTGTPSWPTSRGRGAGTYRILPSPSRHWRRRLSPSDARRA